VGAECTEYYIVESSEKLVLRTRECLAQHYKDYSITNFALKFYNMDTKELGAISMNQSSLRSESKLE
jgi:hypothetical protein